MRIKYSCRGPTDWSKLKLGDTVIIYEGWNIPEDEIWNGIQGIVTGFHKLHYKNGHPSFEVTYGDVTCFIYPSALYPQCNYPERKVLGKILN